MAFVIDVFVFRCIVHCEHLCTNQIIEMETKTTKTFHNVLAQICPYKLKQGQGEIIITYILFVCHYEDVQPTGVEILIIIIVFGVTL